MCTNYLITAVYECVQDDPVPANAVGNYLIVITRTEDRPVNAKLECGVAWLPADTENRVTVIVYRQMIPGASFIEAIQNAGTGNVQQVPGNCYPMGEYYSTKAAFEVLGCPAN